MNFIKNVIERKVGELEHIQFQKFSKGEFRNKALITAKRTGNKFTINTSAEFANEMIKKVAEKLGDKKTKVTGAIVSTSDLKNDIEFKEIKQFQGVKRYLIDFEMSGNKILELLEKFPKNFFALSFEGGDSILKVKPKAPKSAKPGKGDEAPKPDFCKLITTDAKWGESFIFEKSNFKEAKIVHTFFVDELILPKDEKDYAKVRELAKRKGRILRSSDIDGIKSSKEYGFEA